MKCLEQGYFFMFTKKKQLRIGCVVVVVVVGLKVSLLLYAAIARERRMDYNNRLVMQIEIESAFFARQCCCCIDERTNKREKEKYAP
jgi:hypothetical protein